MIDHIVVKKIFEESNLHVYKGSEEDCEFVRKILDEYHKYDKNVSIEVIGIYTEFDTVEDFIEEYKYEYNKLNKKGKL